MPIPDPSEITSREIERAKTELRSEVKTIVDAQVLFASEARRYIKEIIETRLDGMDKTHVLVQDDIKRAVIECAQQNAQLGNLFEEKLNGIITRFDGIAVQFRERDIRTDQDKIAASTAVNAALQAQKEAAGAQNESNAAAITKSENSFTKEIDGLKQLINATKDTIQSQIANLTGRLDRGEGVVRGGAETRSETRLNVGSVVGVIGGVVGVLALLWGIVQAVNQNRSAIGTLAADTPRPYYYTPSQAPQPQVPPAQVYIAPPVAPAQPR